MTVCGDFGYLGDFEPLDFEEWDFDMTVCLLQVVLASLENDLKWKGYGRVVTSSFLNFTKGGERIKKTLVEKL